MTTALAASFDHCRRVARAQAGNFYHAFRILPRPQRLAMCALYAFMRATDDLADEPGDVATKAQALHAWRRGLDACLAGDDTHPAHAAVRAIVRDYGIPPRYLNDVIDGCCMDLHPTRYGSFADLYGYCYRVASAVGLCCIHIWGFRDPAALKHAEAAGVALQLTNILRDIGEDAERGRVYLPADELQRYGCDGRPLHELRGTSEFRELMRFQVGRARDYYRDGAILTPLLPPPGRAVFQVMLRTYAGLLDGIERRGYDVFSGRVSLSRWHKWRLVAQAVPTRLGWTA